MEGDFVERPCDHYQKIPDTGFDYEEMAEYPIDPDSFPGLQGRFTGFLKCNSSTCNEYVAVIGYISRDPYDYDDPEEGHVFDYDNFYYPLLFDPPIKYFTISSKIPEVIQDSLKDAFRLYWADNSACGNAIRRVVEILLNHEKIRKRIVRQQKSQPETYYYSLHERLDLYGQKNSVVSELLKSIKWIGNAGSHTNQLLNRQVLDAFDLLNLALSNLYIQDTARLTRLSKKINKRKRPV